MARYSKLPWNVVKGKRRDPERKRSLLRDHLNCEESRLTSPTQYSWFAGSILMEVWIKCSCWDIIRNHIFCSYWHFSASQAFPRFIRLSSRQFGIRLISFFFMIIYYIYQFWLYYIFNDFLFIYWLLIFVWVCCVHVWLCMINFFFYCISIFILTWPNCYF